MHYSIINTLCSTYFSKEDGFFMEKLRDKFEETRREISLGQDIVTEFIIFVKIVGSFLQLSGKELAGKWGKELLERKNVFSYIPVSGKDTWVLFALLISLMRYRWPQCTIYSKQTLPRQKCLHMYMYSMPLAGLKN